MLKSESEEITYPSRKLGYINILLVRHLQTRDSSMHFARTDRQLSTYIYYRSCFRYRTAERLAEFLTSKLLASDGKSKDAAIQYEGHTTKRLFNVKVSTTHASYLHHWPRRRSKATGHSRNACYTKTRAMRRLLSGGPVCRVGESHW